MCLESTTAWYSTKCCLTWRVSATKRGRPLFRLVPLKPRTSGIGFGLWPTLLATQGGADFAKLARCAHGISLQTAVALYPTLCAADGQKGSRGDLYAFLNNTGRQRRSLRSLLPTLSANDYKGSWRPGQRRGQLTDFLQDRGCLNPAWAEWLMGYPTGWTASAASATPWSPSSPASLPGSSRKRTSRYAQRIIKGLTAGTKPA